MKRVRAVADDVVTADDVQRVVRVQPQAVGFDVDAGIDVARGLRGGGSLGDANPRRGVGDLALEVGQVDLVVVDDADCADSRRRQVQYQGRAEPARADDEDSRVSEFGLTDPADLGQEDVAGVAVEFVVGEIEVHGGEHGVPMAEDQAG